jgi:hypothetical protein
MRYVVLHHKNWPEHSDHYDLMLQTRAGQSDDEPTLRTFSSGSDEFPAAMLRLNNDHRQAYLTYEGPLSENRGTVKRSDEGELTWLTPFNPHSKDLKISLAGKKLNGKYRLLLLGGETYLFERID